MIRFDKPCVSVAGAVEYFREHMRIGDYLGQDGRSEMTWAGQGAALLHLTGPCRMDDFERLCSGRHPATGQKLLLRDKGNKRRVGFFGQISPPKDVSIACLVGGDSRIAGWWTEAVRETLHEIEAVTATRVRRGGLNEDRTTGNMVAAVVTHEANRSLDPQLHTHVCIMNLTWDDEEVRWKSVQPSAYYRHQGFFREVCYNRLAVRLRAAGYELERVRGIGFNIKEFPPELRETFSKRRRQILDAAAEAGITSQNGLQAVTSRTRADKINASAAELREGWIREAGPAIETVRAVIAQADGTPKPTSELRPVDALVSAEEHVFERRSVVDERLLLREALMVGRGQVSLDDLRTAIGERVSTGALFRQGEDLASRVGLEAEDEFVSWVEAHREDCGVLGDANASELKKTSLDEGQAKAVATLLASRSRVTVFQGDAGTGKTHSLKSVVAAIGRRGTRIFGCAPSSGAADVLRKELTPDANTLQQLLANPQLQATMRGRVIIVDEAGLMSVRQMRDLCRLADTHDYRLLLVGDTKQHGSVEAGDALRAIQKFTTVPVARLAKIRRQKDPRFREAVADLAAGEIGNAVARFRKLEAVREIRSEPQLYATAATDYINTLRARKTCLVISPVWAEIHDFTLEVRRQMRAGGLLSGEDRLRPVARSLDWTREWRRQIENYKTGDLLWFHRDEGDFAAGEYVTVAGIDGACLEVTRHDGNRAWINPRQTGGYDVQIAGEIPVAAGDTLLVEANEKSAGLKNGDRVEVAGFGDDGAILLKDGRQIPPSFRQFVSGYASTSHGSQGKTVNRGILIMADEGIATANLKQAYVSNSRFQESQMIYTTDIEAAREAMGRMGDRLLASELVSPKNLKPDKARSPASPEKGLLSGIHHAIRASARALLQTFADPTEKTASGHRAGHN